ncbi:putative pentatricopeptide repeat-containing protein At3g16710, mitochondrial [Argentina anserina]|uniref:putative pentatricopeptide repeat-containing protein At3g16710, mitochondrial n=1 Tax=Argentina anserina TaxID=57926 RepID=UPI002176861E|nr:putative pentatricopeptide repeat-containing protein At3g16710, mitochondrial [Potentilla anserina]
MATDSAVDDVEQQPEDLREVLDLMFTEEALIRNTIKMVEGLLREGYLNVALEIGAKVQDTNEVPRVVTDTAVIEYYINAAGDRTKDALKVFNHMLVSGVQVQPNAYTYAVIIKALAAADLEKNLDFVGYAKRYFVEMLDRGMQPSEETYEAVLNGIGRRENRANAEEERREFVENVKAKGFKLVFQKESEKMANPPQLKSEMDMLKEHVMKVFEDVIRDFEDENEQRRFRQMAEDYDSLSATAFNFYDALVGKGLIEEAKELFKPLFETAILPDEAVFTICILFSKTTSDALRVYEHMLAYGITTSSCTYNVLIAKLSLDDNFTGHAKKYYLEMLDKGMKPCLMTSLALFKGIACLESLENGEEFFEQVKLKEVLPCVEGREHRFTKLMKAFQAFDNLQKKTTDKHIQKILSKFSDEGFGKHASKIFCAMVEDGNVSEAMDLFQSTAETRINPMVIVYTTVIEGYIKCNKNKDALQTYLDMLAAGLAPNSYVYSVLIKGLAVDANFLGDAKKYLIEMVDKQMLPNAAAYTAVFESFTQEDQKGEEEGKEFLKVMVTKGFVPDAEAVKKVLKGRPTHVIRRVMSIILSKLE